MGQGGTCPPNIYEEGTSMVMSPNILGLIYLVTATTVVCCILMQILCVVSQKASASGDFIPQTPYRGSALDSVGGLPSPRPPVFFCPPNNPARLMPLVLTGCSTLSRPTVKCFAGPQFYCISLDTCAS